MGWQEIDGRGLRLGLCQRPRTDRDVDPQVGQEQPPSPADPEDKHRSWGEAGANAATTSKHRGIGPEARLYELKLEKHRGIDHETRL